MSTLLSKNYAHLCTDFYKGIDQEGPYYDVVYLFDNWFDADSVANEMMGSSTGSGAASGIITRISPHQHPLSPNLYCRSARVEGVGAPVITPAGAVVTKPDGTPYRTPLGVVVHGSDGVPNYAGGFLVRATYRPPPVSYSAGDDPMGQGQIDPTSAPILWCTQEIDWETEFVSLPNNQSKWSSDGTKTGLPLKVEIGITIMVLTFHQVPFLPMTKFRTYRGKVNASTFLGAAAGTVLFPGGRTRREFNSDGSVNQQVVLTFKERSYPWSQSLRPSSLAWDTITDGAGTPIYGSADFSKLVQF